MTKARDIADGVDTADIADGAISANKLNVSGTGTAGQVLQSDGDGSFTWVDTADPFTPTTVSGTTPSLNVGSYNFFSQGTLTGNTTVSFSNVPTSKRFAYDFVVGGTTPSNLYSVATLEQTFTLPTASPAINYSYNLAIDFAGAGQYLYILYSPNGAVNNGTIAQYTLSTPYDISTAGYTGSLQIFGSGGLGTFVNYNGQPTGLSVKEDGSLLRMFAIYSGSNQIAGNLSFGTPYAVSSLSVSGGAWGVSPTGIVDIATSPDGVYTYNLLSNRTVQVMSGSWNYHGGVNSSLTSSTLTPTSPKGIAMNTSGTKGAIVDSSSNTLYYYTLSTAHDWSTATEDGSISGVTNIAGLTSTENMTRLYTISAANTIAEYDIYEFKPYSVTLPASVQNSDYYPNTPQNSLSSSGDRYLFEFVTTDGGTNVWKVGSTKYDDN
jgi:hypothetical protein